MPADRDEREPADDYVVRTPLDLNAASREELRQIEGIGAGRADEIVAWRDRNGPFGSVDELQHVPQITPDVLRAVRDKLKV